MASMRQRGARSLNPNMAAPRSQPAGLSDRVMMQFYNSNTVRSNVKIALLIIILLFVIFLTIVGILWLADALGYYNDSTSSGRCRPTGNDCLSGRKSKSSGNCLAPQAKKNGAKCENVCFVPESIVQNDSDASLRCTTSYDTSNGNTVTQCVGSQPVGTCEIADDCDALLSEMNLTAAVTSVTPTCQNGTCIIDVVPTGFPAGCNNDATYQGFCLDLVNDTLPTKECLQTSVVCGDGVNGTSVVSSCVFTNSFAFSAAAPSA